MIAENNVTLRIGKKALFEDVNIKFTEGNCYGLIGANGAGKSTFLKILSGDLEPTSGEVSILPKTRMSVLKQDQNAYNAYNVMDTVIMGNQRLYDIGKEKDALYAKEEMTEEDGIRACELEEEYAELGGWEAESDASRIQVELDRDDGRTLYEVEFHVGRTEYSYEIDASSGAVLKAEQEIDD